MYIWDQCFMLGGRAADWRKVLPVVCVTLLKVSLVAYNCRLSSAVNIL